MSAHARLRETSPPVAGSLIILECPGCEYVEDGAVLAYPSDAIEAIESAMTFNARFANSRHWASVTEVGEGR